MGCFEELNPAHFGEPTIGIESTGVCGCPNDCMGNGRCHDECKCDDGYKGLILFSLLISFFLPFLFLNFSFQERIAPF